MRIFKRTSPGALSTISTRQICSCHGVHIADLSISESWETGTLWKQPFTLSSRLFGAVFAAATSSTFVGWLRRRELPERKNYRA